MHWKDIPGYSGFYQAHPDGVIRSVDRQVHNKTDKKSRSVKGTVIKQQLNRRGYFTVSLRTNGFRKQVAVHRLIAMTFIPNDEKSALDVDHINGIRTDNRVSNLRWLKRYQNCANLHTCRGRTSTIGVAYYPRLSKPYRAYGNNAGEYKHLGYFSSLQEAKIARQKHLEEVFNG
ncbi:hypothetical protein BL250_07650 [Erwinia sp. OLTSP20]|uniref:NUMOD4 domain-containing protein n=1 Tax=unclassified Erwinia TaxID=2622719 RepID=UPI000C189A6C|nr:MULTISPECIES: NUMOD4 domain-containing protein [unclassified Erwinia]PIJ50656.1 hypothetical protein BV501_07825 [Erwinia sp. OAMSP11]PIJ72702.1 hypothetical protein BK416_08695 [Erwinia sp. OLSSP12]PIJ83216.1 hypothetical protein BLD47_05065 [Erwinia sp. OLCASP19]PIJ85283.1 hypothetical protein BLD46_06665 [Erwinia sp. OLMTSP26]PIJ87285.1 hypothetical protein BLD49_06680 [Erwinia sp. OLMDSP33]